MSPGQPRVPRGYTRLSEHGNQSPISEYQQARNNRRGGPVKPIGDDGGSETSSGRNFTDEEGEILQAVVKWRGEHPGRVPTICDMVRILNI